MSKIIQITVTKIEIRPAMVGIVNFPKNPKLGIHEITEGIKLYVEGKTKENKDINFFTEQATIKKCEGKYVYERLTKNPGGFFKELEGEIIGHEKEIVIVEKKRKIISSWIEDKTKVIPTFEIGETISLSYSTFVIKFGFHLLKDIELLPTY